MPISIVHWRVEIGGFNSRSFMRVAKSIFSVNVLFLIYINDLPRGLHADIKLFAEDTLLFSVVDDIGESASKLNNDLIRIQEWAYQWKMSFNSNKTNLYFNNVAIVKTTSQKHLGLKLDAKIKFNDHINEKIGKAMKGVGLLRKLRCFFHHVQVC